MQSQEMMSGGRYLSSDDAMRVFAAGAATNGMTIEVRWRNGGRSVIKEVQANRIYEVDESSSEPLRPPPSTTAAPLFQDVSALIRHAHEQEAFDDFARQPLLPNRLSTLGPGVSWIDFDGDGWEDLVIAGGKGSSMAVYRNDGHGGFSRLSDSTELLPHAQTTVLGWKRAGKKPGLLAGWSNYDDGGTNVSRAASYDIDGSKFVRHDDSFPGGRSATGPLAMADLDGDGELELFVGGRCVPGRWPEAAFSSIFRQREGKWSLDGENSKRLSNAGLVSGAVFSDIDGDGDPDLVLACEWGPLRVFRNDKGFLSEVTDQLGLSKYTGWWSGVTAGDFDGDGRMDLIASNFGRNTKYERFRSQPLRIYYGDFNGDGGVTFVESCYDPALQNYGAILNVWTMSQSMPWLLERFNSYEAFSRANVTAALGDRGPNTKIVEATWLDTTLFLNRGDHFEARPLPVEAQVAPGFGICVADFDGDGNEDVFLAQNFFGIRPDTSRYDAGRGLLLRGDGRGGFAAVDGKQSGILIYGEQRGAATGDYDGDGRMDLAVTQVGSETKLYRNQSGRPGLRVRLLGPERNPQGVGAVLGLKSGNKAGPAHEIHCGSGYWSEDSATTVLTSRESPTTLEIRWPGGKMAEVQIPAGAAEFSVDVGGRIQVIR